jgi:hypothetical protein
LAKKKPLKKTAKKPLKKPAAKKAAPKPVQKGLQATPKLRRIWFKVRRTYNISLDAFSNALSSLNDEEANMLYELVRLALFKGNPAQIIRANPEMKEFVHNDEDRVCMHDIYEHLSWRLGRKEPMSKERALITKFRMAVKGSELP